jgi:hypothetical protein
MLLVNPIPAIAKWQGLCTLPTVLAGAVLHLTRAQRETMLKSAMIRIGCLDVLRVHWVVYQRMELFLVLTVLGCTIGAIIAVALSVYHFFGMVQVFDPNPSGGYVVRSSSR